MASKKYNNELEKLAINDDKLAAEDAQRRKRFDEVNLHRRAFVDGFVGDNLWKKTFNGTIDAILRDLLGDAEIIDEYPFNYIYLYIYPFLLCVLRILYYHKFEKKVIASCKNIFIAGLEAENTRSAEISLIESFVCDLKAYIKSISTKEINIFMAKRNQVCKSTGIFNFFKLS